MCSAFPKNKKQTNPDLNQTIHNNYRVSDTIDGGTVGLVSGLVFWDLLLIVFILLYLSNRKLSVYGVSFFVSFFWAHFIFTLYASLGYF